MIELMGLIGWIGVVAALALAAIGSAIGCTTAGQAAIGAMLDTDAGYGRYVGVSALPSSQTIYGIVIALTLSRLVAPENAGALLAIGGFSGVALCIAAVLQGQCCASAIGAIKEKPEVFGLSLAPAALVEGFAVFVFVFALVLAGALAG
jgi:V/A-type H+-transporting ATPase subunit K